MITWTDKNLKLVDQITEILAENVDDPVRYDKLISRAINEAWRGSHGNEYLTRKLELYRSWEQNGLRRLFN